MKKIPVRRIANANEEHGGRFSIRSLSQLTRGNGLMQNLHRHDFFLILFVEKGKGLHEIDFNTYEIAHGSIFCLRPGQVHQLNLNADAHGYLLEFDNAFFHPKETLSSTWFKKATGKNHCILKSSALGKISVIFETIYAEYTNKGLHFYEAIRLQLRILFLELMRQSATPHIDISKNTSYLQERFEHFMHLLESQIADHKLVSEYAEMMKLSTYQLNVITKVASGKTASDLINEQIILEAKRNLLATSSQVKDIAWQLGYEDVSYFIRFFKKHTGQSPAAFRNA